MSRFRQGTLDHDGDGKMGGSNPKEADMATTKKNPTKPKTAKAAAAKAETKAKVAAKKEAVAEQFAEADAAVAPVLNEAMQLREIRGW